MITLRASLITWFGLSLGIAGLAPLGFANEHEQATSGAHEQATSGAHEQTGTSDSEETPMTIESFRSLGDGSVFERLKVGQRRVCFSICNNDLCYEKVQTRKFVKAYTDWLGRDKEKEKVIEQKENVFRCPAPACDHTLSFGDNAPWAPYRPNYATWGEVVKHLVNEHGWYLSTVALPSTGGSEHGASVRLIHCIDTDGPSGAALLDASLTTP